MNPRIRSIAKKKVSDFLLGESGQAIFGAQSRILAHKALCSKIRGLQKSAEGALLLPPLWSALQHWLAHCWRHPPMQE